MAYTTIDDPSAYFQTLTYNGNGSARTLTFTGNSNLQPDLIVFRETGRARDWMTTDTSRGLTKYLHFAQEYQENTITNYVQSVSTNSYTIASGDTGSNDGSGAYFVWAWNVNNGTVTNTPNGTQTTNNMQMSTNHQINSTTKMSICTYQGATSYGSLFHGLGETPDFFYCRSRTLADGSVPWIAWHKNLDGDGTRSISFTSTGNQYNQGTHIHNAPDSDEIFFKDVNDVFRPQGADSYYLVAFKSVQGFSKFGRYIGIGTSDGAYVYTGFKPSMVWIKGIDTSTNWMVFHDKLNDDHNVLDQKMGLNRTEAVNGSDLGNVNQNNIDFLSNGFKARTGNTDTNLTSGSFIYCAWAKHPIVTSSGIPTTAF